MRCEDPEFIVSGTVESGKSHPLLQRLYQFHCEIPNLVSFICRKKKVDMRKSILDQWEHEVLPYPIHDPRSPCVPYGGHNPSAYLWKNGGTTYCFGMREAEAFLGARFDIGYVCQAEQLTLDDWEFLAHRTGRAGNYKDVHGNPKGQIFADANPDVGRHWVVLRIAEGKLTNFKVSFRDSIIFYRDGDWTEYGKQRVALLKETITGIRYRRLILGEWCNAEGVIFPEFDEAVHVVDTIPDWVYTAPVYIGIDYGHTSPLSAVWLAHNESTDELLAFQEWSHTTTLIEDHIDAIQKHSDDFDITFRVSDHDSQMNHQLSKAGIATENADKGKGSILRGLDFMRLRLRKGTLKFYKGMLLKEDPVLKERNAPLDAIAEMSLYRHKPIEKHTGDSTKDDLPMEGQSDHRIDAIRYVVDRVDMETPLMVKSTVAQMDTGQWTRFGGR